MTRLRLGVALALAALGVSCSTGAESFPDTGAVGAALRDAGVACSALEVQDASGVARERAICDSDDASLTLFVFEDAGDRDRWASVAAQLGDVALGPNWAVVGPRDAVARVVEGLGGEAR